MYMPITDVEIAEKAEAASLSSKITSKMPNKE
jgi:hypothetical protein